MVYYFTIGKLAHIGEVSVRKHSMKRHPLYQLFKPFVNTRFMGHVFAFCLLFSLTLRALCRICDYVNDFLSLNTVNLSVYCFMTWYGNLFDCNAKLS